MRYNVAADSFYIMKLCSRLFVLDCRSRPKYNSRHFDPHFEEVGGGAEPWSMARWKALAEFIQRCKLHRATCRRFDTIPACDGQTDGRTDRRTDGIDVANTALAMRALRAL